MAIRRPTNYDANAEIIADLADMADSIEEELEEKVDKVEGKGLSTNDYTTAEKQKLAGIETQANKTVVDVSLSETSTNPVQNKKVYEALAEKQEQIDALVEKNSTMKKQQLKGQAEGSSIQLTDSAEGLEIENVVIKGAMSQNTYEGYNLLNPYLANQTLNGVTVTYNSESQEITLNGTCTTDNTHFDFNSNIDGITVQSNGKLYGKIVYVSGSSEGYLALRAFKENYSGTNLIVYADNGVTQNISGSVTCTTNTIFNRLSIRANSNSVFNNLKIKLMFSTENVNYEPYCGGEKSPNINYTQKVQCVTGTNIVEEKNKNWIKMTNGTRSSNGITFVAENGITTLNGTATATSMIYITLENPLTFKANIRYTLSTNNTVAVGTAQQVCGVRFGNDMNTIANFSQINNSKIFYFNQDTSFNQICIRTNEGITYENFVIKPQLEIGTASTDFVEGEYQNIPLTLGNIELYDGDKIQISFINKAGYKKVTGASIVKTMQTSILWRIGRTQMFEDSTVFWSNSRDARQTSDKIVLCSHLSTVRDVYGQKKIGIEARTGTGEIGVRVPNEIASTLAEFNSWIINNNVKFAYALAEPITTPITDPILLSQLETLINLKTHKQITNIDTTGSDLAPVLEFQYSKDLQTVIDNMQAQILA